MLLCYLFIYFIEFGFKINKNIYYVSKYLKT